MSENVTTEELQTALDNLAESMGLSTVEYVQLQGYATVESLAASILGVQTQLTAITEMEDNGAESLAEKIKAINNVLSNEDGAIQAIYTQIQENKQLVLDETTRATVEEADLQSQITVNFNKGVLNTTSITDLTALVSSHKIASDNTDTTLSNRLTATESDITILKGTITTVGSILNSVDLEKQRAILAEQQNRITSDENIAIVKIEAITVSNSYSDTNDAKLQTQLDSLTGGGTGSLGELESRVKINEDILKDTLDVDENLVIGISTRTTNLENALDAESILRATELALAVDLVKDYADSKVLKASSMNLCLIKSTFRTALGLSGDCVDSNAGDGSVI